MFALHSSASRALARPPHRARHAAAAHCCSTAQPRAESSASTSVASRSTLLDRRSVLAAAAVLAGTLLASPSQAVSQTTKAGENVGYLSNEEVDRDRAAHRMKRAFDGKVAVQHKQDKHWYDLKVEPNMPGLIYFRRDDGPVYYVAYGSLSQCDLADDDMVAALSDDEWESAMRAIEFEGEKPGATQKLELTREGFYGITSLINKPGDEQEP